MLNICSANFDFISGYMSDFICSVYRVLKDIPAWPIYNLGQSLLLSLHSPVNVCLSFLVLCVCFVFAKFLWGLLFEVYAVLYLIFLLTLSNFLSRLLLCTFSCLWEFLSLLVGVSSVFHFFYYRLNELILCVCCRKFYNVVISSCDKTICLQWHI